MQVLSGDDSFGNLFTTIGGLFGVSALYTGVASTPPFCYNDVTPSQERRSSFWAAPMATTRWEMPKGPGNPKRRRTTARFEQLDPVSVDDDIESIEGKRPACRGLVADRGAVRAGRGSIRARAERWAGATMPTLVMTNPCAEKKKSRTFVRLSIVTQLGGLLGVSVLC